MACKATDILQRGTTFLDGPDFDEELQADFTYVDMLASFLL